MVVLFSQKKNIKIQTEKILYNSYIISELVLLTGTNSLSQLVIEGNNKKCPYQKVRIYHEQSTPAHKSLRTNVYFYLLKKCSAGLQEIEAFTIPAQTR